MKRVGHELKKARKKDPTIKCKKNLKLYVKILLEETKNTN